MGRAVACRRDQGPAVRPTVPTIALRSPQPDAQSPDRVERMAVRELGHLPWGSRNRLSLAGARVSQAVMSACSAPVATVETLDVSCREPQAEDGPGVVRFIQPHAATQGLRCAPADMQAEPYSAVRSSQPMVYLIEAVEDPLTLGLRDLGPEVTEREADTRSIGISRYGDRRVGRREFERVVEEIRDDPLYVPLVRPYRWLGGREPQNDPVGFQLLQSILDDTPDQPRQSNGPPP